MPTTQKSKDVQDTLTEKAREIWLAGLGLFSTVEQEGEKLFNKFIERGRELEEKGESFEKKAKEKVEAFSSYVNEKTGKYTNEFTANFEDKFKSAMQTFGVSSKSEVKNLSDKVDKLADAVAGLGKKLEEKGKSSGKASE